MISVHCCGGKLMSTIFPIWEYMLAAYWLYQQLVCYAIEYSVRLRTLSLANDSDSEPVCRQITQICLYLLSITRTFMTDFE